MHEATTIRTTCPYCGVGCGVLATRDAQGEVSVKGDPDHPANYGRLCSKGSTLAETLSLDGRLLAPRVRGLETGWDQALSEVANAFSRTIAEHGPNSVAIYGSGQLLTEDYYVANKLMKGFIGSGNIDTNSRLCMASTVAGHKRAFGSDTVPGCYEDLEEADLVVLVGSNFAWCHPVLFQRLMAARDARGTKIVVIDPRKTVTADAADIHLALNSGSDVALINGLAKHLFDEGAVDQRFVARVTEGERELRAAVNEMSADTVAHATGLSQEEIMTFFEMFRCTEKTVTVFSQGVNQSSAGTDKVNAILNCHLLTGRIGKPGMGPFSITGQPNAMGGREVGGLANQLAAHMDIDNPTHRALVERFWSAPAMARKPGLKAVELFQAMADGRVKAVWIMATNPAASLPMLAEVEKALTNCELVVVSDVTDTTKTARFADILLPAQGWAEKDGTVTNSERRISRQRKFMTPAGVAKPDWWIISEVAKRMGFQGFDYEGPADVFKEHAALSAFENNGTRDFDLSGLTRLSQQEYDALAPIQWPVTGEAPQGTKRLFGEGAFFTATRKAKLVASAAREPASSPTGDWPWILNTGRIRDQWHTMTRTGKTGRLFAHTAEPFVELHPADAATMNLKPADIAVIENDRGKLLARVAVTAHVTRGTVFMPMHWTEPFANCADVGRLIGPHVDPISGQPELKHTPVSIRKYDAAWYGLLLSWSQPDLRGFDYWATAPAGAGWRAEIAHHSKLDCAEAMARKLLQVDAQADLILFEDRANGTQRVASVRNGLLDGVLMLSRNPVAASRNWLIDQMGKPVSGPTRFQLLAGRAGADQPDIGAIVCSCFNVGVNQISAAAMKGANNVDAIGAVLKAGTNCGSCRVEMGRILESVNVKEAV